MINYIANHIVQIESGLLALWAVLYFGSYLIQWAQEKYEDWCDKQIRLSRDEFNKLLSNIHRSEK